MTEERPVIDCVVEGHGEVQAVPTLVRRIGELLDPPVFPEVRTTLRRPRSQLVRAPDHLRGVVQRRALRSEAGGVLVVLDADDDCPGDIAKTLAAWAVDASAMVQVGVVLANREFESWFLAGIESLRGVRGVAPGAVAPEDAETVRDAKGRLDAFMVGESYRPVIHQASFAARLDIAFAADRSRSLRKLVKEVSRLVRST